MTEIKGHRSGNDTGGNKIRSDGPPLWFRTARGQSRQPPPSASSINPRTQRPVSQVAGTPSGTDQINAVVGEMA